MWFSIFELRDTGAMVGYELSESFCQFTLIFKQQYFVWVKKFYDVLKESFLKYGIAGWSDFQQEYSYNVAGYVTVDLISKKNETFILMF